MSIEGKDRRGRFTAGNDYGRGRPHKTPEMSLEDNYYDELRDVLQSHVTPADFSEIVDRAVKDAKKGNATARSWISALLGLDRLTVDINSNMGIQIAVVGKAFDYNEAIGAIAPIESEPLFQIDPMPPLPAGDDNESESEESNEQVFFDTRHD